MPDVAAVKTQNLATNEFMVFPNPADENIHVKLNLNEMSENVSIKIYNLNGKEMQAHNYQNVQKVSHNFVCFCKNLLTVKRIHTYSRLKIKNGQKTTEKNICFQKNSVRSCIVEF